jgi:hypothetical protein
MPPHRAHVRAIEPAVRAIPSGRLDRGWMGDGLRSGPGIVRLSRWLRRLPCPVRSLAPHHRGRGVGTRAGAQPRRRGCTGRGRSVSPCVRRLTRMRARMPFGATSRWCLPPPRVGHGLSVAVVHRLPDCGCDDAAAGHASPDYDVQGHKRRGHGGAGAGLGDVLLVRGAEGGYVEALRPTGPYDAWLLSTGTCSARCCAG